MNPIETDRSLWESFLLDDETAYEKIYSMHIKAMYRYGMSLVPVSEAFVLDCIHDVFAEIWARRKRLSVPENVRYYLLKSLKNRIIHALNRHEHPHHPLDQADFESFWMEPSAEEILTQKEEASGQRDLMQRLISQLPHRQQEALRLRFTEDLDYQEIGEVMSVNRQSAQNLVFRAMEKLRSWMVS